jgi:predicted Zn-dependent protease with MMP-like domain
MHPVSRECFADLVAAALAALPDDLRLRLDHVQFSIEDEPSRSSPS